MNLYSSVGIVPQAVNKWAGSGRVLVRDMFKRIMFADAQYLTEIGINLKKYEMEIKQIPFEQTILHNHLWEALYKRARELKIYSKMLITIAQVAKKEKIV